MITRPVLAILVLLALPSMASAHHTVVLGFEDLEAGQHDLPTDYAGLTWDPNFDHYDYLQWPLDPASSGPTRIIYGRWIDFGAPVTFKGSWVGRFEWGGDVFWRGFREGEVVYESDPMPDGVETSGWIRVDWPDVDRVELVSAGGNFAIDDITYQKPPPPCHPGCVRIWWRLCRLFRWLFC